eukprot:TRINITY_DN12949_c0_g1_i1.p1 TRINITY_DN12949_c0_g1~~TRINITY_DN12949_c0_g1_i1.p1  ORF type:complete len:295 (-),score=67.24 TRINITY_DN12949_c0_g1_i1:172-1056(-)
MEMEPRSTDAASAAAAELNAQTEEAEDMTNVTVEEAEGTREKEKDKGNVAYADGKYEEAVQAWNRSLQSVKYILDKDVYKDREEQLDEVYRMELRLCLNMSQGHLKLEEWSKAIVMTDRVLEREPKNTKALYRKASALMQLLSFDEASRVLDDLLIVEPTNAAAKSMLAEARRRAERGERREKRMSQRMFARAAMPRDPRTPPSQFEAILEFLQTAPREALRYVMEIPARARDTIRHWSYQARLRWRRSWKKTAQRARKVLTSTGILGRRDAGKKGDPKRKNSSDSEKETTKDD